MVSRVLGGRDPLLLLQRHRTTKTFVCNSWTVLETRVHYRFRNVGIESRM